jgi:pyruvate,water dikinase
MGGYVLSFQEIDPRQVAVVGGKGAHLGELSRMEGIRVPAGYCVTTDAFRRIMAAAPSIDDRLDRLSRLEPDDRDAIRAFSADVRAGRSRRCSPSPRREIETTTSTCPSVISR